ncbi:hypothetical protein C0V73_20695 [Rhizobium sp. TH135]|uniref:tyrosine-protein kinase domain-containing protein n=1 Tax=Rhizobium sp. TH135 TaxID=2067451 RepID=UPI000C7A4951|nr:tyrosine-protein kinase domain-containing protein [Rhizobium sp. TH135]PLK69196.1 hypothetical protein C0V73_20695 [Rhizobium sp. TH135]
MTLEFEVRMPSVDLIDASQNSLPVAADSPYDLRWMLRTVFGKLALVVTITAIFAGAAVAYVLLRPAEYTAVSTLNINNLRLSLSRDDAYFSEIQFDPTFLETQIQIIGSDSVLNQALVKLGLVEAPKAAATPEEDAIWRMADAKALDEFRRALAVQRRGMSNLVSISFSAEDPQYAAQVANTVSTTYLEKLDQDRSDSAETASSWLRESLQEVGPKAQIVSEALPPVDKSNIRGVLLIAAAISVGAASAITLVLALAAIDKRIKTPEKITGITGRPCLGLVPTLRTPGARGDRQSLAVLAMITNGERAQLWHTLRHVDATATTTNGHGAPLIVGFTSTVAGEGTTTIAANYAAMKVLQGQRTLLVDGQLYNSQLSRLLNAGNAKGLSDILGSDGDGLLVHVVRDEKTGLELLPLGKYAPREHKPGERTTQVNWSDAKANTRLAALFAKYDVVVIDLPPLVAIGDVQSAAHMVDHFVMVLEWGRVTSDLLQAALVLNPRFHSKLAGIVLNRADRSRMRRVFSPSATLLQKQRALSRA